MKIVKKSFLSFLMVFFVVSTLVGCANNSTTVENTDENKSESTEKIIITVNNWTSATHNIRTKVLGPWKDFVEKETNGRVEIEIHDGAVLGPNTTVVQDVMGGKYDLGQAPFNYYYNTPYFLGTWSSLPFAVSSPAVGTKMIKEFLDKYGEGLTFNNVYYTGVPTASDPYVIYSSKPIKSIDDLQGLSIRTPGSHWNDIITSWGAKPVSLELGEAYEGLLRGTIDAVIYSVSGGVSYKFYEVAPHIVDFPLFSNSSAIVMNKTTYDSLPDDLKTMFDDSLFPKLMALYDESYETSYDEAWKTLSEQVEGKGEIVQLSEQDQNSIKQHTKVAWENWIADADKNGFNGQEMVDYIKEQIVKETGVAPF